MRLQPRIKFQTHLNWRIAKWVLPFTRSKMIKPSSISYRPAGDNSVPTLSDGTELTLVTTVTSTDPTKSISVDILQDSAGNFYVTSRGTANLQNVVTDLQLENNDLSAQVVSTTVSTLQTLMGPNPTVQVEVLGHSLGGYLSLQIASGLVDATRNAAQASGQDPQAAVAQLDQHLSVRTYDAVGIPDMTAQQSANLNPITTNWRDVVPGSAGTLSNGMRSVGRSSIAASRLSTGDRDRSNGRTGHIFQSGRSS